MKTQSKLSSHCSRKSRLSLGWFSVVSSTINMYITIVLQTMYINVVPASENPIHVATVPIWYSKVLVYCIAI